MQGELDPFEFALAEKLGRTVHELRLTITQREYAEWMGFYQWKHSQEELNNG